MNYDLYLDKILLPVAPEKITIKVNSNNKTVSLINDGQCSIIKKPQLTVVEFECLFPAEKYPFASYPDGFRPPKFYTDKLKELRESEKPFRFILARTKPDGKPLSAENLAVTLEDYKLTENADSLCDITASIKLREYRSFAARVIHDSTSDGGAKREPSTVREIPVTVGCDVIVNGRLYKNSYGAEPGKTLTNYHGKINYINMKGSHPYHVTTPNGDWLGWVLASAVKAVT